MHHSDKAPKWLNKIWKFEDGCAEGLSTVCTVLFFGVISLIMVQVVFRYVLRMSCAWAEELARYIWMPTVFLGCAYVTHIDKHIDINLSHIFIAMGKTRKSKLIIAKALYIYRFLMVGLIGGFYSVQMLDYTKKLLKLGKYTPAAHVPQWIFIGGMTLGMILICLSCLSQVIYGFIGYDYEEKTDTHSELDEDFELGGTS